MSRPTVLSLRLYGLLARAFPDEFKNAYGAELLQATEDSIEDIWRHHGLTGLARLLLDIAVRLPAEHLAELWQDIRYGLRMLAASPGFTLVALTSLSLGICAATAAFSKLNATVFRNLPHVTRPEALVALETPVSYPNYLQYREHRELFSASFAYAAPVPFGVILGGQTKRVWGQLVTPDYFSTLGVRTVLGRNFDHGLQQRGGAPEVVVSYRFWQTNLGSNPAAIGSTIRINGHACTVRGVAPADFQGQSPMIFPADLWMPVTVDAALAPELADHALERRNLKMFHVVGRLQQGVSVARVETELDAVTRQLEQEYADPQRNRPGQRVQLVPGRKDRTRSAAGPAPAHCVSHRAGGSGPAACVFQRRQHDAGACRRAPSGDRSSPRPGRQPRAPGPPVAHRKHADRGGSRSLGLDPDALGFALERAAQDAAPHTCQRRNHAGRTGPFLHPDPYTADRTRLRPGTRPASHPAGSHSGPQGGRRRKHPPLPRPQPAQWPGVGAGFRIVDAPAAHRLHGARIPSHQRNRPGLQSHEPLPDLARSHARRLLGRADRGVFPETGGPRQANAGGLCLQPHRDRPDVADGQRQRDVFQHRERRVQFARDP